MEPCDWSVLQTASMSPTAEAGILFSNPGGMLGWVDLCYVKATSEPAGNLPATCESQVQRPNAASPRNT